MEILDKKSLILSIGDVKLSDTEYTFENENIINGYEYESLFEVFHCNLGHFLHGDYRTGSKIKKDDKTIYYAYSANRSSSNAQEIAIGYFNNGKYHFLKEGFTNIYQDSPELIFRSMLTIDDLCKVQTMKQKVLIYYSKIEKNISKKDLEEFKRWIDYVKLFEDAFSKQNLDELSKTKRSNYKRH